MKTPRPLVLVIMGVSGSGKSTIGKLLAQKTRFAFIEADDHHPASNIEKMKKGIPLNDADREPWLQQLHRLTVGHINKQQNCILACSALKNTYRRRLDKGYELHFRFIHLKGKAEAISKRLQDRAGHFMPPALLDTQFKTLEDPVEAAAYPIDQTPETICTAILNDLNTKSEFGLIGMGVMGTGISRNLAGNGVVLSLYNREVKGEEEALAQKNIERYPELQQAKGFNDLSSFIASLARPRKILLMIPSGAVRQMLVELTPLLSPGDVIIDGGNSNYKETAIHSKSLAAEGIYFLGCGISGGEKGALTGPALMPGGQPEAYLITSPYFQRIAARDKFGHPCFAYLGKDGAGHFTKIIHNGIEYAEMQLLAESYHLIKRSGFTPAETHKIFTDFNQGALSGFLLSITCDILDHYENGELVLNTILDKAGNKGTGSWATIAGAETGIPASMISEALFARYLSFFKGKRKAYQEHYQYPERELELTPEMVKQAYTLARIVNHTQGFDLLNAKKEQEGYTYTLDEIARIWTGGCIIRSELMESLVQSLKEQTDILLQDRIVKEVKRCEPALKTVVMEAIDKGIATPALSAALNYLNGMRETESPANLIQAQRDLFGAHQYQKRNDPSEKFYHTQWDKSNL